MITSASTRQTATHVDNVERCHQLADDFDDNGWRQRSALRGAAYELMRLIHSLTVSTNFSAQKGLIVRINNYQNLRLWECGRGMLRRSGTRTEALFYTTHQGSTDVVSLICFFTLLITIIQVPPTHACIGWLN